jgi:F420-non-reducing hydrogenase iron-sulfur subunit
MPGVGAMTAAAQRQIPKVVIFTCNWEAYRGLDEAGRAREAYPADVRIVRLPCLARLHPGLVLKTFQAGADGVLVLGCPPEHCHFGVGSDHASEVIARSSALIRLLGFPPASLALEWVPDGRGEACAERIRAFVAGLMQCTPVDVAQRQVGQ